MEAQLLWFVYVLSVAAFEIDHQSWSPELSGCDGDHLAHKPKIFTEQVCQSLQYVLF